MDNNNKKNTRRASEPNNNNNSLALVSGFQYRVPPPLPYLPSDYLPSPDSPRHIFPRKRSHSFNTNNPVLAIENGPRTSNFELVPYRDFTVISRNAEKGQLVLFDPNNQSVSVRNYLPDISSEDSTEKEPDCCPYCHTVLPKAKPSQPDFMDRNYFRLLASAANSPASSRIGTYTPEPIPKEAYQAPEDNHLNANAFNEGYYEKFFIEMHKLGKGFRGSVFLCEHVLDGVKLGQYAVKKVAIGNNHPWLVRMLREVHLLERLRHPNIVSYKHSWLEYHRFSAFGPKVPCLYILMECANGGNLEEYMTVNQQQQSKKKKRKMSSKELKIERIRRQYKEQEDFENETEVTTWTDKRLLTMTEIWSLLLNIVQGLNHLHSQNIVHRDLKPPNLLLQYDDNRLEHTGIPRILISDFGECEDLDDIPNDNRTGATGTLEFMAPEHVRLDPVGRNTIDYSPKADMWSLGMVLYYLCYSRLPFTVIDDVDRLRDEILAFKDVPFPKSRYEIYQDQRDNPLYNEALQNPDIKSDIPKDLKLLIRLLLSTDPSKRPSCSEIISKITRFKSFDTSVLEEVVTEPESEPPTQPGTPDMMETDHESSQADTSLKRVHTYSTPVTSSVRKRQKRIEHAIEDQSPRLLMDSPAPVERRWLELTDQQLAKVLKTSAMLLKLASCHYSCSPYTLKPWVFYPVLIFATFDFWSDSTSPSFILIFIHILWILATVVFSNGLCQAPLLN